MNLKNKKGKRLTSTLMAVLMSVSTTCDTGKHHGIRAETSSAAVESTLEKQLQDTDADRIRNGGKQDAGTKTASGRQLVENTDVSIGNAAGA